MAAGLAEAPASWAGAAMDGNDVLAQAWHPDLDAEPAMTLAYWCVLIAILLPYLGTASAKFLGAGYGPHANQDPRAFLGTLEGWRKRANNAQLNGFEVTPAFAAAVIIAHLAGGAEQALLDQLAVAFIVSRLLYFICYLANWGPVRSLVWFVGLGLIVALFVVAA